MKNNGNFKVLNAQPQLLISHKDLKAIEHIVDIAPQEAQWFNRVEKIVQGNHIYYRIYEMYIPEQYCSAAQVETDPMMMVSFFKELQKEHGNEKTNEIMSNLTSWSHSHHTMGVSPSGQDVKQFNEQCKNAMDSGVTNPQIMMIFNKKDSFYSKVFDPELGLVFEHVPFVIQDYDFDWITKQAKDKFKKPKYKAPKTKKKDTKNMFAKWNWTYEDSYDSIGFADSSALQDFVDNNESFIFDNQKTIHSLITKHYKTKSGIPLTKNLKRYLKNKIKPLHLFILNLVLPLDPQLILDIPKYIENEFDKAKFDEYYEDLFETLNTEGTTKEEMEACSIFAAEYYQFLNDTSEKKNIEAFISEFITAIESEIHEETTYTWR
jgi:hypothetical protein